VITRRKEIGIELDLTLKSSYLFLIIGLSISLLMELANRHPSAIARLTLQYRMNSNICDLSNDLAYNGELRCANEIVKNRKLALPGFPENLTRVPNPKSRAWLKQALDPDLAVQFLDTDGVKLSLEKTSKEFEPLESSMNNRIGGSLVNQTEATLVKLTIVGLTACGFDVSKIGVVCPFRAQVQILEVDCEVAHYKKLGLEISTIDRFQGRDKEVIIISFVRSNTKGKVGRLLLDFRRLNVAVSRARSKLIMIGSYKTLYRGSKILKPLLDRVRQNGWIVNIP
jgi:DNA replication ATP-dependent helicase Dna2